MELKANISQKDEIIQELEKASQELSKIATGFGSDQYLAKLIDGKWSAAENVDHLNLSSKAAVKALGTNKLLLRAFGTASGPSRSHDELLGIYKNVLRNKSPKAENAGFGPQISTTTNQSEHLAAWESIMQRLRERLAQWSEKDLDKYCIKHPAIGKLSMREFMFFTIFHTRHHYNAIERLSNV